MEVLDIARRLQGFSQELVAYKLGSDFADAVVAAATILERSERILRAGKEDRLVILPAKKVYEIAWVPGPECNLICPVIIDGCPQCDMCENGISIARETKCRQEHLAEIGKTTFLTKEEAEEAITVLWENLHGEDDS